MAQLPETRNSLLLKVRNPEDADAWSEFAAIYRPAIYRLARRDKA
jgi:RNA polymerase sigma-70 factor (ECF subfamily)